MANTSRSRSASSSRGAKRSTSGKSARSSSTRRPSGRNTAPVNEGSGFGELIGKFASSKASKPVIFIAVVLLIVGIDLLISWDKYAMFFKILGIEVLLAVIVWVILTLVFSSKKNNDADGNYDSEV